MIKLMIRTLWPAWAFAAAAIVTGLVLWNQLPANLPMHFNLAGDPDAFYPRLIALFMLPLISVLVCVLTFAAAHFQQTQFRDPAQASVLTKTCTAISFLLFGLHLGILLTSIQPLGITMNEVVFVTMGLFLILFGMGIRDVAPNKYIGFKFPWNRDNTAVWRRTHDLFYRWFVLIGGVFVIAALFYPRPELSMLLLLIAVAVPTAISYQYARRGPRSRDRRN